MAGADIFVLADEAELDAISQEEMKTADRATQRKVEIIQSYVHNQRTEKPKQLYLRFLVSPVELIGNEAGQIVAMRLVRNELYQTESGAVRSRYTDQYEEIPVGLVFRSIGYKGVPIEGVPFNDSWG